MDGLLHFPGQRVGDREVAFPTVGGAGETAVPAPLLGVLFAVDGHRHAVRQRRDVEKPGFRAIRRWPIIVAARLRWADLLGRRARVEVANAGIGLDVLSWIVFERLA